MPTDCASTQSGVSGPVWLLLAVAGACTALLFTCRHVETPTTRYATLADARAAGALAPGRWLPPFLPESATDIVETHDVDTNAQRIDFKFSPGDLAPIEAACTSSASKGQFICLHEGARLKAELTTGGIGRITSQP